MARRETKIQKIPLNELIETLVSLYNHGVDYVDIIGEPGEQFDKMAISFVEEYMTDQGKKNFFAMESNMEVESSNKKLSDEDLNQLL